MRAYRPRIAVSVLSLVIVLSGLGTTAQGQTCSTTSVTPKLICVVPQLYGPQGFVLPNPNHAAHFLSSFQENFTPLNSEVGQELSLVPLASPASGIIYTFDKTLGTMTPSSQSFGPILAERSETIGRHKFFFGGTYQYFSFGTLDGLDLNHLPVDFLHKEAPSGFTNPPFVQDYITTDNSINLKLHQITLFGTFGLTDRIDVSVAVPILSVHLAVASRAHIVRLAPCEANASCNDSSAFGGEYHFFDLANPVSSTDQTFTNGRDASGIGDVIFRVKGTVVKKERFGLAAGLDVRAPSGDATNFLGSGAAGVKPFVAMSYRARVAPHLNLGYQWNGDSILAGDITTGTKASLPNQFFYTLGVDVGISRRWTGSVDLLGQRIFDAQRVRRVPFVDVNGTSHSDVPQIELYKESFNTDDLATGLKFRPGGNFLVTGNLLVRLDSGGLRARVVPLIGLSYSF
jgi:hypothetical protein